MSLSFEEATHTYRLGGRIVPSVTQILRPLESFEGIPVAILDAARDFGVNCHLACHLDNIGQLDEDSLDPALAPYLAAWRAFKTETGFAVTGSEARLFNKLHGYAGTADAIGALYDRLTVIDIKSGIVPSTVGCQLAAYQGAAESMGLKIRRRLCVQLAGDGRYKLLEQKDPADWNLFLSAKNLFHWLQKRKRIYGND